MWFRAGGLGHAHSLVCGKAEKKGAEGPPWTAAWSTAGMAQLCSLRRQSVWHITQRPLTEGKQAGEGGSFGWQDNICCSWLSLRQVLLRSAGQVQVFQGVDPAPTLLSPHCFKTALFQHFVAEHVQQNFSPPAFFPPAQL